MALIPLVSSPATGGVRPLPDSLWRVHWLLAAPHRLAFFSGAVMMALSALWWCTQLYARSLHVPMMWAVSPSTAHAMVMSLGFMPLFFTGFLFTAGPKWLGMPEPATRTLLPPVLCYLSGWLLALVGFHASTWGAIGGLTLVATAYSSLAFKFSMLWWRSRADDKAHALVIQIANLLGALALWLIVAGLVTDNDTLVRAAVYGALWFFIATVFACVSHRMIPFFSASAMPVLDAWRPMWLLWTMVAILWCEGLFAVLDLWLWPAPEALRWLQVAFETPTAALMLWLAIRWGLVQSLKIRLLAMLHGGFLWLGIALALQAVSHTLMALSHDQQSLGLAPLHAMTMGYLGATLFAMATRVSSGHSGRPLAADNKAWALYWVVQCAVLLRVASAVWPTGGDLLLLAAVSVWVVATCGWALRYGSWFGRPRVDGRSG
jgi:uncharacterized protein involved in response to NO